MADEPYIITPKGNIVNTRGGSQIVVDRIALTVTYGTITERFSSPDQLEDYLVRFAAGMETAGQAVRVSAPTIERIAPSTFDITTDTISIYGFGFVESTIGTLWIEDEAGGQDSNGYSMTCTFVSPTELSAVFASAGDTILSTNVLVYYKDSGGVKSNSLLGTNTGGTTIVMS